VLKSRSFRRLQHSADQAQRDCRASTVTASASGAPVAHLDCRRVSHTSSSWTNHGGRSAVPDDEKKTARLISSDTCREWRARRVSVGHLVESASSSPCRSDNRLSGRRVKLEWFVTRRRRIRYRPVALTPWQIQYLTIIFCQ